MALLFRPRLVIPRPLYNKYGRISSSVLHADKTQAILVPLGIRGMLEEPGRKVLGNRGCFAEGEDFLMDEFGDRRIDILALLQETSDDGLDVNRAIRQKNRRRFAFPGPVFSVIDTLMVVNRRGHPGKSMFIGRLSVAKLETYDRLRFIQPNKQIEIGISEPSFCELSFLNSGLVPLRQHSPSVSDLDVVPKRSHPQSRFTIQNCGSGRIKMVTAVTCGAAED